MFSSQQKIYLAVSLSFLTFLGLSIFVARPFFEQAKRAANNVSLHKTSLLALEKQIATFEDFQRDFETYRQDFQKIKDAFINQEVPLAFINFLESRAKEHDLEITIVSAPASGSETELWPGLTLRLTLQGLFVDCLKFLEELENSQWILDISQLNAMKSKDILGETVFNLVLVVFSNPNLSLSDF